MSVSVSLDSGFLLPAIALVVLVLAAGILGMWLSDGEDEAKTSNNNEEFHDEHDD